MGNSNGATMMLENILGSTDRQDTYPGTGYCPAKCSSGYLSPHCACPSSSEGLTIDRNLLLALVLGAAAAVYVIYQAFVIKAAAAAVGRRHFPDFPGFFDTFRIGKLLHEK